MDECSSPSLIAAFHVLHRLKVPRHSPHALSSLTIKLVHKHILYQKQNQLFTDFGLCQQTIMVYACLLLFATCRSTTCIQLSNIRNFRHSVENCTFVFIKHLPKAQYYGQNSSQIATDGSRQNIEMVEMTGVEPATP